MRKRKKIDEKNLEEKNSCRKIDRTDSSRTVDRKLAWPIASRGMEELSYKWETVEDSM